MGMGMGMLFLREHSDAMGHRFSRVGQVRTDFARKLAGRVSKTGKRIAKQAIADLYTEALA